MLSLAHGIDVALRRPVIKFGDKSWPDAPTGTVRVGRKVNPPQRVSSVKGGSTDAGGEAYLQDGLLYVYRGTDVRDGDKVSLPEGDFIVNGGAQNDGLHPMNGHDFGVVRYAIERTVR